MDWTYVVMYNRYQLGFPLTSHDFSELRYYSIIAFTITRRTARDHKREQFEIINGHLPCCTQEYSTLQPGCQIKSQQRGELAQIGLFSGSLFESDLGAQASA